MTSEVYPNRDESPLAGLSPAVREILHTVASIAHTHKWEILAVKVPPRRPLHPRTVTTYETIVLLRCMGCNIPETVDLDGEWTEDQIRRVVESEGTE